MFNSPFQPVATSSDALQLLPIPSPEWQKKFTDLMQDEYLSRKYNRDRRIRDHYQYLRDLCPTIFDAQDACNLKVVDIGPGPGELLEIARDLGYKAVGYDAKLEDCEMGVPYIALSAMMAERQQLNIEYCGFETILPNLPIEDASTFLINSRGSIEQVFKGHLLGVPHREHHDARRMTWSMSAEMLGDFKNLFSEAARILVPGGYFLIHGNGATNIDDYHRMIVQIVEQNPVLVCDGTDNQTLHRVRKT